ncbi:MAG TPA: hypothetical protein VLK85_20055 [Ramlibacter sp.]|nr:hypothetical protein [Ramlibacter sp.]
MINLARKLMLGALAFLAVRVEGVTAHSTSTQTNTATGVAVDSGGNFLLGGYTQPSQVLPGFLAKVPAAMSAPPTWQRKQSLTARFGLVTANSVGVDSSDNVYAIGQGYVTATPDLPHLFKYNSAGALQWQRKLTAADNSNCSGLAVTSSGDCFFALGVTAATAYGMIAKYNSSGTLQGQRKLTGTYRVYFSGLRERTAGGALTAGHLYDGGSAASNSRGLVVAYDSTPAIVWQKKVHFGEQGSWDNLAEDAVTGDIILGGSTSSSTYGVVLKLSSDGTTVAWHKKHPTSSTSILSVAVDSATGYVYFTYGLSGSGFVVGCLDSSGSPVWLRNFIGNGGTTGSARELKVSGSHLLVVGSLPRTSQGTDAVLLRLPKGTGGAIGAIGWITSSEPAAIAWTTGAPAVANAGLTDAAGTHTDAAGTVTDAAETLTFTAIAS